MKTFKDIREKVKDGKVDALSKMGKQKLTSLEISNYYKDNPSQKKAARDKDVKKGIELALDLGGAQTYAVKELEKFKRGLSKHPAVKKALQHANEQVESLEEKISPKEFSKLRGTYKDKISGAIIEFDSQGFVVEPKNGKVVPFEWKNMMAEGVISEGRDTYKSIIQGLEKDKKVVAGKSKAFGQNDTKYIDKAINFIKQLEKEGIPANQISQVDFVTNRVPKFFIGPARKSPSLSKFTPNDVKKAVKHAKKMGIIKEAVSPAQQAAIAIAKKEKGEKPKTEHKGQFIYAAKQAKKKGEKTFVFAGKTYNCEEVLEDKEICPKCEGKGCDHCNDIGYHEAHKKGSKCKTESFMSFVSEEVANITVDPRNKLNSGQQQSYYAMEIVKNARRFGLKGAVMHKHVRIKGPKKKVNDFLRTVIGKSSYGDPTEKDMTTPQVDKMLNKGMKGRNESSIVENYRILARKGMGAERKGDIKVGTEIDFYETERGDKRLGKVIKVTNTGYTVQSLERGDNKKYTFKWLDRIKAKKLMSEEIVKTELEEKRFSARRDAMKDIGKSGKDSADVDDYKATDDDRKAADKNVIMQIRRGADMPKGCSVTFKDGTTKKFPQKACQIVSTKFDSIKKPMVKRKFQDMANQSFAGLKKAMSIKG